MTPLIALRAALVTHTKFSRWAVATGCGLALFSPGSAALAQARPAAASCESVTDVTTLNTTLPLDLLDYLEKISSSAFVHAFVLSHVAETGNPEHGLTRCVRRFLDAGPDEVEKLRENRVAAGTLIRALRAAERARLEDEQLRAGVRVSLDTVISRLRQNPAEATLAIYTALLGNAESASCVRASPVCTALRSVRAKINSVSDLQRAIAVARAEREAFGEQLTAAQEELRLKRGRIEAVESALASVAPALVASPPDSVRRRLVDYGTGMGTQLTEARNAEASQQGRVQAISDTVRILEALLSARAAVADHVLANLRGALDALHEELQKPAVRTIQLALPDRQQVRTRLALTPPTVIAPNQLPRDRSASVLMELTDFVIDRAKQEVVVSYLATLYRAMQRETLLKSAFPNTHQLMRGLTARDTGHLSAVAAGRIPLPVWRATLKNDFTTLPINLLQAPDSSLCRGVAACRSRVVQLRPTVAVVQRLMQGQPVFEVIRDAPLIATEAGTELSHDWSAFIRGLRLLSAVAETYQVQGLALGADPIQHPFILSLSALSVGDKKQQEAFVRLLVLRIVPEHETQFAVDVRTLTDASRRATAAVEAIAMAALSTEPAVEQARQVLGSAVAALRAADGIATLFARDTGADRQPAIRQLFLTVAEPLVVRDYALAMARTAVLLREVTGAPVSSNLLTLASLASGLAEAQSGAEVRAALEAASSPVGGWQAKRYREGRRTSITAFPGLAVGGEWVIDGPYSRTAGVALPIGPEVQLLRRSLSDSDAPGCFVFCSVGLFVPVVDLGALLSYRLKSSDIVESEPNSGFRQVFAPGLYVSLGVGRSALAMLVGGQFMPGIRKVSEDSDISGHAWRLGAALTLDVMLFGF